MTAFDVEGYRKAATAAGISNAEIENEIKFQTSAPAKTDPFEKDEGGFKLGSLEQVQERLGNDWWHLPAGLAAIGAGIYGASKLMGGPDDPNNPNGRPTYRFDPTFDVEPLTQPAPQANAPAPDRLQQAQQILDANRQMGLSNKPVAPVPPPPPPPAPIGTPLSAAPVGAPAPTPTTGPGSFTTTAVVDEITDMIKKTPDPVSLNPTPMTPDQLAASFRGEAPVQPMAPQPVAPPQELRTGTGKPAFAGMGPEAALNKKGEPKFKTEYASVEAVPRGFAFVPGAQYIDPGRQDLGQPLFTKTYMAQDYPSTDQMARQQASEINRMLNKPTRAELKAAGLEPAPNTPGITKKTSAGTKPVRVAGTLGALMAITDLAKAETPGQRSMAAANLLEAILPPGFTMSGAGEGSDMPPRAVDPRMANINMTNASMFAPTANDVFAGNPYAQSELAKRRRQEAEYTRKVGAGRGDAPPSAYMR
jgi:hypothetical protein